MKRTSVQALLESKHRKNSVCVDKYPDEAPPRRHHRSKSVVNDKSSSVKTIKQDLHSSLKEKEKQKPLANVKDATEKHERMHLEQNFEHVQPNLRWQKATNGVLKHAFPRASSTSIPADYSSMPQNPESLINDIALLEVEVMQLEQHLLSLYRKAFELKAKDEGCVPKALNMDKALCFTDDQSFLSETSANETKYLFGNSSSRSSSLAHPFNGPKSSIIEGETDANKEANLISSYSYSQPIPSFTRSEPKCTTRSVSLEPRHDVALSQSNSTSTAREGYRWNHLFSPNKLSEELVRCMAAVFCKLADPPIPYLHSSTSITSSNSESTLSSKKVSGEGFSPHWKPESSCTPPPTNQCQERNAGNLSPHASMISVHWINADNAELRQVKRMLENFKFMVRELERVDPCTLKHEEKLAFWLNIYNALMMHAYLTYGIPENYQRRMSLSQKASYKVGAYMVNAHKIEHRLLCCRSNNTGQWIQSILSPVSKMKAAYRQAYAINKPEPLVCFGICHGGRSDPAIRVYTAKNVYQELNAAKRDFLQANVTVKGNKILVPRLLDSFARGSSMASCSLIEWISLNIDGNKKRDLETSLKSNSYTRIEWVPYNFNFRYLFVADLIRWFPPSFHPSDNPQRCQM